MAENDPKIFIEELTREKKIIEKCIKQLEDSIRENETKYLQSTVNTGNILRGWEHIFTSKSNKTYGAQIKKPHISNNEKLFSQTFEFDNDEITENKNMNHNNDINHNHSHAHNEIKVEESNKSLNDNLNNNNGIKNINIVSTNNHKNKRTIKNSLGQKRKRNNNINKEYNEKQEEQKNA